MVAAEWEEERRRAQQKEAAGAGGKQDTALRWYIQDTCGAEVCHEIYINVAVAAIIYWHGRLIIVVMRARRRERERASSRGYDEAALRHAYAAPGAADACCQEANAARGNGDDMLRTRVTPNGTTPRPPARHTTSAIFI